MICAGSWSSSSPHARPFSPVLLSHEKVSFACVWSVVESISSPLSACISARLVMVPVTEPFTVVVILSICELPAVIASGVL